MSKPQFSLIIPTYNRGYILWKAILSVQAQTFKDWELLVIDDGSTDDTQKVLRQFQSDKRIHYYYKKNKGVSSARNFGIENAKGSILSFIDSDDEIYSHYLETAHQFFKIHPSKSFVASKPKRFVELYDDQGVLVASKEQKQPELKPTLPQIYNWSFKASIGTGFFIRSPIIEKVRWNESLHLLEDLDFIMNCSQVDPNGFDYIQEELYLYKQRYGTDGACHKATYLDWSHAFGQIYALHKDDPLMTDKEAYFSRIEKYQLRHEEAKQGREIPPQYKFFPEYFAPS